MKRLILSIFTLGAFAVVGASSAQASWSSCWFGTNTPSKASNGGIVWQSKLRCNATQSSITLGGELWDNTLNTEIDGTNGNPPHTTSCGNCSVPVFIGDGITTVNSYTAAGSSCLPGHQYVIWTYGWVDGVYKQQEFGPWGPLC